MPANLHTHCFSMITGSMRTFARIPILFLSLLVFLLSLSLIAQGSSPIDEEALILLMGPSGKGKTTSINIASGSRLDIGSEMEPCVYVIQLSPPVLLGGRQVIFANTPLGFEDTKKSEADVLKMITHYLTNSYEEVKEPTGVIYTHNIPESRASKAVKRSFHVFCKHCGDGAFKNVVILTNMWGSVSEDIGTAREQKLASMDSSFAAALGQDAKILRNDITVASDYEVIRSLLRNALVAFQTQREIVDEKKGLHTDALQTLYEEASKSNDLETSAELQNKDRYTPTPHDEERPRWLQTQVEQWKEDLVRLSEEFENEKTQHREEVARLEEQRKAEAAAAAERERKLRAQAEAERARKVAENDCLTQIIEEFKAATDIETQTRFDASKVDTAGQIC